MGDTPSTSRRDFLQGRSASEALLHLTQGSAGPAAGGGTGEAALGENPQSQEARGPFLLQLGRAAMACQFELYFNGIQYPQATLAGMEALDRIEQLEDQLSIYRPHSELSKINRVAPVVPVPVEAGLFGLLEQSLRLHRDTAGAFDITAGPLSRAWGFFRRAGRVPSGAELAAARELVGSQYIELNAEQRTVRLHKPGMELSLNSIGKGYALDRAADLLLEQGIEDFMFHGGQSSVLARGTQSGSPQQAWTVGLRHPLRPELRLAEFYLRNRALATSGTGRQHFHFQGKRYGHLLDPRTGEPAEGVYSATVIAPTAAEADALATAFYVLGPAQAAAYCTTRPDLGMLLVSPGEKAGTLALQTAGLAENAWQLLAE